MVYGLFLANLLDDARKKSSQILELLSKAVLISFTLLGVFWLNGYFVGNIKSIASSGYGGYSTNLLSLIDPDGWSYVLPNLDRLNVSYEGFAYLGLGNILLMILVSIRFRKIQSLLKSNLIKKPFLIAVIAIFIIVAVTNHVHIASYSFSIYLPDYLMTPLNLSLIHI